MNPREILRIGSGLYGPEYLNDITNNEMNENILYEILKHGILVLKSCLVALKS